MIDYSLPNIKMTSMNGRLKNPNLVLRTDRLVLDIIECLSIGCGLLMSLLLNCLGVCSPMDVWWWIVLPYLVDLWMPLHIWMLLPNMLVKWPIHCLCFSFIWFSFHQCCRLPYWHILLTPRLLMLFKFQIFFGKPCNLKSSIVQTWINLFHFSFSLVHFLDLRCVY